MPEEFIGTAKINLKVPIGRGWRRKFTFQDGAGDPLINDTWVVKSECREEEDESSVKIWDFKVDISEINNGIIYLYTDGTETSGATQNYGFYDILFTPPTGPKKSYVEGSVEFNKFATSVA